jgi:hypothetical protein
MKLTNSHSSNRLLILFLLAAVGVMLIGSATRAWDLGFDSYGMYPSQDCGRNHWLNLHVGDPQVCVPVNVVQADEVDKRAAQELVDDGTIFEDLETGLAALQDHVAQILESIAPAW